MRLKSAKSCMLGLALFCAAAGAFAGLKNNDFTKASKSFTKTYRNDEKSRLNDEKSRMNDEKFNAKTFKPEDNAEYLRDSKYKTNDNALGENWDGTKYRRGDETFTPPERKVLKQEWSRDSTLNWENKNRTLNEDYAGKRDLSKKHPRDSEMRAFYESTTERSMQDINKYMFRSSHSSEPGVPLSVAGSQLRGDDATGTSFVEDLVFGRKSVNRGTVPFKKNMDIGTVNSARLSNAQSEAEPRAGEARPQGRTMLPPQVRGEQARTNMPPEKKVVVHEEKTDKVLMETENDKGVKRGKTIIRVEVGQPR